MSGTGDKIKGRVKEALGVLTDSQRLKVARRRDQVAGKVKNAVARLIDKTRRNTP